MLLRLSLTLAAGFCLVGCNQEPQKPAQEAPGPEAVAPAAGTPPIASETNAPSPARENDNMTTTSTGLRYEVLKKGDGTVSPKPTDTVRVHYHGTLLNGKVFDSSVQRGQPISFELHQVIDGWTEGLQLMKVGDKFRFEIPPHLGYGEYSPSPMIPRNSTLVFEVELLGIQ